MLIQQKAFQSGEGDKWFERNAEKLRSVKNDPVLSVVDRMTLKPKRVLEIGCSNGWRLEQLQKRGAECAGIDPSAKAISDGNKSLSLQVGTADKLPFADNKFDFVLFGFCLYLVDPALHFKCIAEADRVLSDGGLMIVYDFITPTPYANDYSHLQGVRSHKMEFSRYFTANPAYALIHREIANFENVDDRVGVDILIKNQAEAFKLR